MAAIYEINTYSPLCTPLLSVEFTADYRQNASLHEYTNVPHTIHHKNIQNSEHIRSTNTNKDSKRDKFQISSKHKKKPAKIQNGRHCLLNSFTSLENRYDQIHLFSRETRRDGKIRSTEDPTLKS